MFTIRTQGPLFWVVVAEWFGKERIVHGPAPLFGTFGQVGCLDFVIDQNHR